MNKTFAILAFVLVTTMSFAQVGIGTKTPAPNAVLDLTATDKGFLPPRVTTAQRDAIASPPAGLVVFNSTTNRLEFSNGTNWINLTDGSVIIAVNNTPNNGSGGVGIGTKTPAPSAVLDLTANNKGFLPPRVTTAERDAIASPPAGLVIYNTTDNRLEFSNGTSWISFIDGSIVTAINGAANTSSGGVGIGTSTPNPASILELLSTVKGFLPPRLTSTERDAIISPATGLTIYNTTNGCLEFWNSSDWISACSGNVVTTPPNPNLTVAFPTYQGVSVINNVGIGYNGEAVPSASTITVLLTNNSSAPQNYVLNATDATTGLTYVAAGNIAANAVSVPTILNNNNVIIPEYFAGVIAMPLRGASNSIFLLPRIDIKSIPASATIVSPVSYGTQIWMDRNLGARRIATSRNDAFSYGNYYQWGRPSDGHEITVWNGTTRTSGRTFNNTTSTLATSDAPGTPNFITPDSTPFDWRDDNNNNRWVTTSQGPCPTGYHVPTDAEWAIADTHPDATNGNNGWDNRDEAYQSALRLPAANGNTRFGTFTTAGTAGLYWSSTVYNSNSASALDLSFISARTGQNYERSVGYVVRCIQD